MKKSIIIDILKNLDRKELKELGDFIRSPFHNKSKNAMNLYDYLERHYPEFDEKSINKREVFHSVTGKEKYNDGLMRIIQHTFGNLLEEFLIQLNIKRNTFQKGIFLLNELNLRKIEKLFSKNLKYIEKEMEKTENRNYDYYKSKYDIDLAINHFGSWKRYRSKDFKHMFDHIDLSMADNFICYFLAVSLSFYRFQQFKQQTTGFKGNYKMMDEVILFLKNGGVNYLAVPLIRLHFNEVMLLKESDQKTFYILKKMLVEEKDLLPHDLRYSTHNILQLYCSNRLFKGEPSFAKERLELYKIAIEQNLFKRTYVDYFDEILFLSIFTTAFALHDYKWAEKFVNEYEIKLNPANRPFIEGYCEARLCYAKGRFNDALKNIDRIRNVKNWQYKIITRDLILMVYYDLGWLNEAIAQLDAYRHYLNTIKPKLSPSKYERTLRFVKVMGKLIKARENKDKAESLLLELDKTSNINEKEWLKSKINKLVH